MDQVLNLLDEVDHALVVVVAEVARVEEAVVVQELKKKLLRVIPDKSSGQLVRFIWSKFR